MSGSVVVAGSLAQKPGKGGHSWVLLQYLLGLRGLGWDVLFLDRLEPSMCVDTGGRPCRFEKSHNLAYFLRVMQRVGLADAFSLDYNGGERHVGLSKSQVLERVRRADCLMNVMGYLRDETVLGAASRRVFLDIDPGFSQMWHALGLARLFDGYDDHVTVAMNIGRENCSIPTCGLRWIPTSQPVVLEQWPARSPSRRADFTTVGAWRGAYGPLEYEGEVYGLRVHEFRRFAQLPRRTGRSFKVALAIDSGDTADREMLASNGWVLADPVVVASDPWSYQRYIQTSRAEIMIAKNMYVRSRSGWFSDRSICYLASGRPVLVQDTGLEGHYPDGRGLIRFTTMEEAASGVESICSDPESHSRAAREIAEEYFDSGRVLTRLMDRLSGSQARARV